jgi:hypothetical protein
MYDQLHYSAARSAGDFVYLSGVEAGPLEKGDGTDVKAFRRRNNRCGQRALPGLAYPRSSAPFHFSQSLTTRSG